MSDPEARVAKSSDRLLSDLEELRALEQEKRGVDISTPRFHELATKITDKSREVFRAAYREEDIGDATEATDASIDEVAAREAGTGDED